MQILLTQEEYDVLVAHVETDTAKTILLLRDLRAKIMEMSRGMNAQFKHWICYHDLTEAQRKKVYVDEGYCDGCPLSFTQNEKYAENFSFCPHEETLYSK